jgi:hypothetical protein
VLIETAQGFIFGRVIWTMPLRMLLCTHHQTLYGPVVFAASSFIKLSISNIRIIREVRVSEKGGSLNPLNPVERIKKKSIKSFPAAIAPFSSTMNW